MIFNKTYQSLMKSIMEEREWDEEPEVFGYTKNGKYKYESDELEIGDNVYSITADIGYNKHPEGVDVFEVELTDLYEYDFKLDDNVEINLHEISPELRQTIESAVEEDFYDMLNRGWVEFETL